MHTVLAFTELHIRFLKTSSAPSNLDQLFHWQHAISSYRVSLSQLPTCQNTDPTLATATLVNGIAFASNIPGIPQESWPCRERMEDDLWWLKLQNGIGIVLMEPTNNLSRGPFRLLFEQKEPGCNQSESHVGDIGEKCEYNSLLTNLYDICGASKLPVSSGNPYLPLLDILAFLLRTPATTKSLLEHLRFVGDMSSTFIALLQSKDHRALLLLLLWYGKLSTIPCWWTETRARLEHQSIAIYLNRYAPYKVRKLMDMASKLLCTSPKAKQQRSFTANQELKSFCQAM